MKTLQKTMSLCLLALLLGSSSTFAADSSSRGAKKFGLHVGLLGDPNPTAIGYNANYNLTPWMRATAGYGSITADTLTGSLKATTMGGGLRFFLPKWNFSPMLGLSYAKLTISTTGTTLATDEVGGFSASDSHLYYTAGIDWQMGFGMNLGFGVNTSLKTKDQLPFFNLGWYF